MTRALVFLCLVVVPCASCSPGGAWCAQQQRCAEQQGDTMDDESVRVCTAAFDARIRALRENDERECQQQAEAELAYAGCAAALDCEDFIEPDHNGLCESERDALDDARRDAQAECISAD